MGKELPQNSKVMDITGTVIRGGGRSKAGWDYPTANIENNSDLSSGLYVGECEVNFQKMTGLVMIYPLNLKIIEIYLKRFDGDIYGKTLIIKSLKRLKTEEVKRMMDYAMDAFEI